MGGASPLGSPTKMRYSRPFFLEVTVNCRVPGVVTAGAAVWKQVRDWAVEHKVLSLKELEILGFASLPGKVPSEKQSVVILEALRKARIEGCPFGPT